MSSEGQAGDSFSLTSGVISLLGARHVAVGDLPGSGAKAAFLGFPFEGGNQAFERPGSANGPQALRIASTMANPWSFDWDVDLFEAYDLVDCGDAPIVVGDLVRSHQAVEDAIHSILEAGAIPITAGGDHSLAVPGARALSRFLGPEKRMGYLQVDAHLDASVEIQGVRDTNCSGLVRAEELPNVSADNMAILGIRGQINVREWWDEVRARGIRAYPMSEVRERGFAVTAQEALDRVWDGVDGVYVSFDTDSIDSAAAPGTTGPEPGGLTSHEVLQLGGWIGERGLTAVDNVELCPVYDPGGITAKLVWSVLAEMLFAHAKRHLS